MEVTPEAIQAKFQPIDSFMSGLAEKMNELGVQSAQGVQAIAAVGEIQNAFKAMDITLRELKAETKPGSKGRFMVDPKNILPGRYASTDPGCKDWRPWAKGLKDLCGALLPTT